MNEKKKVLKAATSLLSWWTAPIKCQKMVQNNNEHSNFLFFVHNLKDIQFTNTEEEQKPENIHI